MRKYGIRITLSGTNPLRRDHLLGEDWETQRWYDNEQARDRAFIDMQRRLPNNRNGDHPAQLLSKIDEEPL